MTDQFQVVHSKKRYEELDALRGIAALLVVFFHFTMGRPGYNSFFKFGITGVDLFFIISGFVILMSLQKISRGTDFIINRVGRLYPTYWASVTFSFVLLAAFSIYKNEGDLINRFVQYLGNLTMFQFYLEIPDLDGPYWTLIVEMLFYMFALIIFKTKLLKYFTIIGIFFCSLIVLLTHYFYNWDYVKLILWWLPLLQFLPLFLAGATFYNIYTSKGNPIFNYMVILFCFISQISLFPFAGRAMYFIKWGEYSSILFIYFILFVLFVNNSLGFIVNKSTLFFGKISYALYLIHQCISLNFIIPLFTNRFGMNFWSVVVLIDTPIIVGLAAFITYKIEIPYSSKLKEKLRGFMITIR